MSRASRFWRRLASIVAIATLICFGAPLVGAQSPTKVAHVALLTHLHPSPFQDAFVRRLAELGHVEGRNLVVTRRYAQGSDEQLVRHLREVLQQRVDLVFTPSGPATRAVKSETDKIPIVAFDMEIDPVAAGLIASFARPGGNLTGVFLDLTELRGKQLDLLRHVVPGLKRVAVLWDPSTSEAPLRATERAAQAFGIELRRFEVRHAEALDALLAQTSLDDAQALFIIASPLFYLHRARIAEYAIKHRTPALTQFREFADAGGLMSYGPNLHELFRRCAAVAARILEGAKPADLPVERPEKYEFAINLKTAKALDLAIPSRLRVMADETIR